MIKTSRHMVMSVHRTVVALAIILLLPLVVSAASLRLVGERAWLQADDEPLTEVLQLFEQRGAKVFIDPMVKPPRVSGVWNDVEVSWLIAQLASPYSYLLEWQMDQRQPHGPLHISSIRILPDGKPTAVLPALPTEKVLDVITGENGVQYIRGEILVGFRRDSTKDDLEALLATLDGEVIEVISPPGLYRIKLRDGMSVEDAMRLALAHGGVIATEPNLAFPAIESTILPSTTTTGSGYDRSLAPGETAVAVLDSGLDPAYADSPLIRGTYDAVDPAAEISDPNGHGTLTSLIAAGAITPLGAPKADKGVPVLAIRMFDANGMTSSDTIMRALSYAANSGVKIVSMSWGTEVASHFLEAAMQFASESGMTLYAAAGNQPTGTPVYPAGYDAVIAVGGLNPDGSRWQKSNYGDFVDSYQPALANFNDQTYAGTSIASPYAAFTAALDSP
jgi:thermitase